jgi:hypothetical protein
MVRVRAARMDAIVGLVRAYQKDVEQSASVYIMFRAYYSKEFGQQRRQIIIDYAGPVKVGKRGESREKVNSERVYIQ